MKKRLRHVRSLRTVFFLAALVLGGGALIGATGATAGPAVMTTAPFNFSGTNTCTGEVITGTGNLHFLQSDNLSSSGAIEYHLNVFIDGLQAVAIATGHKYVVQEVAPNWEFVFAGASEQTYQTTAHFIRVGEDGTFILGDDFYEFFRAHITVNNSGMITAFNVETSDVPCQ